MAIIIVPDRLTADTPVASYLDIFQLSDVHKMPERVLADAADLTHFLSGQQHLL